MSKLIKLALFAALTLSLVGCTVPTPTPVVPAAKVCKCKYHCTCGSTCVCPEVAPVVPPVVDPVK